MEHATNPLKAAQKLIAITGQSGAEMNQFLQDNGFNTGMTNEEAGEKALSVAKIAGTGLGATIVNQAPKITGSKRSLVDIARGKESATSNPKFVSESEQQPNSDTDKKSFDKPHGNSFEGKKFNEAGQPTKEFQSHLDSVAKKAEKVKYAKNAAKIVGKGGVGAAVSYAAEGSIGWMAQSALNQGNYRTSNLLSAGENTIKGVGNLMGAGVTGFAGGIMKGVEATFGTNIGADSVLKMSNEMIDDAAKNGATAMNNAYDTASGAKMVVGKQRQPLSASATNVLSSFNISPPGGSGQLPGGSGYSNPNYNNSGAVSQASVPLYAQNAFSTPPMSNTAAAM